MEPSVSFIQSFWLFLHMIGLSLIATVMIGTIVAERHLRLASDWPSRARVGMLMKNIGMLSPFATILLLGSGIGNMVTFGFTMNQAFGTAATWLGVKIVLFFIAVINGTLTSIRMGKKRQGIIMGVKNGGSPQQAEAALQATFSTMNVFFIVQIVLFLGILVMVLFKPI